MQARVGLAWDPVFKDHWIESGHPESPHRVSAVVERLQEGGLMEELGEIAPLPEADPWIREIHSAEHLESVRQLGGTGQVASQVVACGLGAVDAVLEGALNRAFVCCRPPGHHAHDNGGHCDGPGAGEGFCYFNTVAVAARFARKKHGLSRVLIVDWDYHHGNGTEWSFYDDPSVLFFSTHALLDYPGTGHPERKGSGAGLGYNINVPLERGAADEDILRAFEKQLVPAAESFKPELILVSAGFDSRREDPLGSFSITDDGFKRLTQITLDLAKDFSGGRVVSFLEGGYNPRGLARAVEAHLQTYLSET